MDIYYKIFIKMVDLFTAGFELYSLETITSSKFKLPLLLNVLFGVTEAPFDSDSGSFISFDFNWDIFDSLCNIL